ncbi:MAG: LysR substrate-binding domain-containing protein [Gammaproteobacteria bacterium]|jgi:aminoethylphosphonate catabolism LysR family transcriptional regulator|nr:LysR substrate-binding domain-containing protein [Gammaproteobacteria bacterium]MDX2461153.1 LysR substrate-binding domain-containing protein [Gammaproteobacteria bacterium]
MNYLHLRAFHAVATHGSFTRAAAALNVTQPTVSDQVKVLENRYEVKLFERHSRRVEMTAIGRALYEVARRQFKLEADAEQLLLTAKGLTHGRLRVAAGAPQLVIPLLGNFKRRHPGIQLVLQFGNSEVVLRSLFERRCDLVMLPDIGADERLYAVPFRRDRLVAFVEGGHPWSTRRSISLADLKGEALVLREVGSRTRAVFEAAIAGAGVIMGETLEIGSREGVREAVAAGLGIGIVSEGELGVDPRLHAIAIRESGLEVTEYAACLAERQSVRVVAAFFDLLKESKLP